MNQVFIKLSLTIILYLQKPSTIYLLRVQLLDACIQFGSLNGVAIGVEGLIFQEEGEVNLISCTQRCVNNQSQTLCLKLFFLYYLFSLLLVITNF